MYMYRTISYEGVGEGSNGKHACVHTATSMCTPGIQSDQTFRDWQPRAGSRETEEVLIVLVHVRCTCIHSATGTCTVLVPGSGIRMKFLPTMRTGRWARADLNAPWLLGTLGAVRRVRIISNSES